MNFFSDRFPYLRQKPRNLDLFYFDCDSFQSGRVQSVSGLQNDLPSQFYCSPCLIRTDNATVLCYSSPFSEREVRLLESA